MILVLKEMVFALIHDQKDNLYKVNELKYLSGLQFPKRQSNKMGIFFKSVFSIAKYVAIILILNKLTAHREPVVESILTQDFITDEQTDKDVLPFAGLLFIQKGFILLIAYLALRLKGKIWKTTGIGAKLEQQKTATTLTQPNVDTVVPLKYEILVGVSAFLSTMLFSEVQYSLKIQNFSYIKHINLVFAFIIIHFWFISNRIFMKISFRNWGFKLVYFVVKCIMYSYLTVSVHVLLFRSVLWDYFYEHLFMQFVQFKSDLSWQSMAPFGLALLFELVYYFGLSLIKVKNPTVSTLTMLISMVKFSTISFGVYALFNGDLWYTLKYMLYYTEGWSTIGTYCLINFIIYLLLAQAMVKYPPSVFLSVLVTKQVLQNFNKHMEDGYFKDDLHTVLIVLFLVGIELILYEWFEQRYRLKDYDKIQGQRVEEMSFTGDNLQPSIQQESESIRTNETNQNNENNKLKATDE